MKNKPHRAMAIGALVSAWAAAAMLVIACGESKDPPPVGGTPTSDASGGDGASPGAADAGDAGDTGDAGNAGDAGDAGDDSGPCLAELGPAPACASATCVAECQAYSANLKSDVAKAVSACLDRAPACAGAGSSCVGSVASGKICSDVTVTTYCAPLVASCASDGGGPGLSKEGCEALAKVLSATGRAALATCIEDGGCSATSPSGGSYCLDLLTGP